MARGLLENFVSEHPAPWFAEKFRADQLTGGHIIKLGPGNDEAAREALAAWPGGMQLGGGIHAGNAAAWLDAGPATSSSLQRCFPPTANSSNPPSTTWSGPSARNASSSTSPAAARPTAGPWP
jgi:hypothetical protein